MNLGGWEQLVLWSALGGTWMFAHLLMLFWLLFRSGIPGRAWALLPPMVPVLLWKTGHRMAALLWCGFGLAYTLLRRI